jgi:hypothetical protein
MNLMVMSKPGRLLQVLTSVMHAKMLVRLKKQKSTLEKSHKYRLVLMRVAVQMLKYLMREKKE